ncbi:MAG TPA: galactokinase family protein [Acidobacteriota bacterium]
MIPSQLCELFLRLYGHGPIHALRVPARINILGEHIDYVSYLPTASLTFGSREHGMTMIFRDAESGIVRGASTLKEHPAFEFTLHNGPPVEKTDSSPSAWTDFLYSNPAPAPHWSNYVKGSVHFARHKYGRQIRRGFDFLVDSGIPASAGASSSSALVVLAGAAVRSVNHVRYGPEDLARDSSQAEWYMGTRGGAMDHLTICLARMRHAVHISYPAQEARLVGAPCEPFRWVTFFSHAADKGRAVKLEYNERSAVARILIPAIIERWARHQPSLAEQWTNSVDLLRNNPRLATASLERLLNQLPVEVTLADVAQHYPEALQQCRLAFPELVRDRFERPLKVRARALHHLGEIGRVASALLSFQRMSQSGALPPVAEIQEEMASIGALLNQAHQSLRDLYEVCTEEVDRLLDAIVSDRSVYGARLMGGGFGGNVLALTKAENAASLIERVQAEYYRPQGRDGLREGGVMVSTPGDGLSRIE